ncbi:MAG: TetR/AcrR family transcriptional regulator [Actinobacteria bacterium]|nr:TetR/AcrR family transcriptional regulator [Actinomycetota bacterium]
MSPRVADPGVAEALVEAGARLIADAEPLTTRRLAAEVGTSTAAVYTHFGSITELRRAIRRVGFERLAAYQRSYEPTDDPVADLAKQGWAYCRNALTNPDMYRVMFMEVPVDTSDAEVGLYTFQMLVDEVQRCIDAGRFGGDASDLALQLWTSTHGVITLHLAGMIDEAEVDRLTRVIGRALFVSFGDQPAATDASFARSAEWIAKRQASESGATRLR